MIRLFGLLAILFFSYILLSQITIPVLKKSPTWPIFRRRYRKAKEKLVAANESKDVADLNAETLRIHTEAAKKDLSSTVKNQKDFDSFVEEVNEDETEERVRIR